MKKDACAYGNLSQDGCLKYVMMYADDVITVGHDPMTTMYHKFRIIRFMHNIIFINRGTKFYFALHPITTRDN